jgi:hypothetical protein
MEQSARIGGMGMLVWSGASRARVRACLVVLGVIALGGVAGVAWAGVSTSIVGGTLAERTVLRQILAGFGPTHIPELRVVRVAGGVDLQEQDGAVRPTWETLVVGGAFLDRSTDLGLPRVLEVEAGQAGWPTSDAAGTRPPPATASSERAIRRAMLRWVARTGAHVAELSISKPEGLAVAVRLRVTDAASFLHHRLADFLLHARAYEPRLEGLYVEVDDANGPAWTSAEARFGGDESVRPSLRGCDPFPPPGPGPPSPFPACPA